jgi:FixJ family two-component response regulator
MSAAGTGTVYVVDDDPGVLRAVTRLLQASGHEVESFDSPAAFLQRHDPAVPGCLVLDLSMPELDGLALQNRLAAAGGSRPIVFISGHADIPASVRAMKAGAVDFLTKPFSDEVLLAAIDVALERSRTSCRMADEIRTLNQRLGSLTAREREVFEHVVAGRLNKLIAQRLGAAEKTVKVHRARVMHKMQASSLADLVRMAERIGIGPAS